ncbi:hypothetical protein [Pendulispora albinea]|uniref:Uncharacterized protein n=1 Tax=Pendulispora albinea TaxID=2741071 RepID=A0ABZ2M4M1_9BACT
MRTAAPQRNFTLPLEDRMRALIAGAPAYMRRKRFIEDIEDAIVRGLTQLERGEARRPETLRMRLERDLAKLNELIDLHNRYYPSEANLPMEPLTGAPVENGAPWTPLPRATMDALHARVQRSG